MKKHLIIAIIIFIVIVILSLASNFIPWDETLLEQTIFALPLGVGLFFQIPFLMIMGLLIGNTTAYVNYQLLWTIIPFIAGIFYAGLYYVVVLAVKRHQKR